MSGSRRVAIVGTGVVAPNGHSTSAVWEAVAAGRSAVVRLEGDGFDGLPVRVGARVQRAPIGDAVEPALARRLSPVQQWALLAAEQARVQSGYTNEIPWQPRRFSVIAGSGSGPVDQQQSATRALDAKGPRAVPLGLAVYGAPDAVPALLSQRLQAAGSSFAVSATCASGAIALGEGVRRIRDGYADAVLVIGYEDCLGPVNLASNANLRSLASGFEDDPTAACAPFDRSRSGFVMGQGAAAILLEAEDVARERGAEVLAILEGFGSSSDAYHPTSPDPHGTGAAAAIAEALADAGVTSVHIDHINAHGTGTIAGDVAELRAFDRALGADARRIPISATKATTGHLLGAGGVLEAILAVHTIRHDLLPPTLNLAEPVEDDWDFVAAPRRARVDRVLSPSFGFGGHNAALVIARAEGTAP